MIVLMAGLPASGKSTLCRELASELSGTVLDKDKFRSAMFDPRDVAYSVEQDDFCVGIILQVAGYILRKDPRRFVFVDGRTFSRTYQIDEVFKVAMSLKQDCRILQCICSDESARKRLANQAESERHPAANRDYDLYCRMKNQFEEIRLPKLVIDTDLPLDACIELGLRALRQEFN